MKYIKLFFLLIFSLLIVKESFTQCKQKKIPIKVEVFFCNSYCGGARPTEEILEYYKKEYVFSNSTFILKKENADKQIKVTTDSNGVFKCSLLPGKYNYYMTKEFNKNIQANFNSSCDIWLSQNFGQIEILPGTKTYKMVYLFGCNPCLPPRP